MSCCDDDVVAFLPGQTDPELLELLDCCRGQIDGSAVAEGSAEWGGGTWGGGEDRSGRSGQILEWWETARKIRRCEMRGHQTSCCCCCEPAVVVVCH